MDARDGIRLAELLAAMSLATDLGRGFPQEKALRTCLIAHHLSEELGLDRRARSDIFYASLIHPVGCTAFTHEAAQRFGTNELVGIPAYARVDTTRVTEGVRAMREEVRGGARRAPCPCDGQGPHGREAVPRLRRARRLRGGHELYQAHRSRGDGRDHRRSDP